MDTARATSFGAWAEAYDNWRPTYPDAAVDWLVPHKQARVVEVGAGTGKLTDRLVERGLELDVVEPDGRMLRVINQRHPGLRTHETDATSLPIGDASVDAVSSRTPGTGFAQEEAAAEVARVLRPGGWLGCVWNVPGPGARLGVAGARARPRPSSFPTTSTPCDRLGLSAGRAEQRAFRWTWALTPQQWRGFVSTVSHVRLLPEDECRAALDETERLVARACAATGERTAPLVHDALCVRWYPNQQSPRLAG